MARRFFCSECGVELQLVRKALKNKGVIVDLIKPHEHDETQKENIVDSTTPTKNSFVEFGPVSSKEPDSTPLSRSLDDIENLFEDKRKEILTSTAPVGVLRGVKRDD